MFYTIGEAIIDFLPEGNGYIPITGGAPLNVASCIAKLNGKSAFIGMVGNDLFGKKIATELDKIGVNTKYLHFTDKANTALAFVSLGFGGEREFAFYRNPSADMFLSPDLVENIPFTSSDVLHFCSVDLIDMPVKEATKKAISLLKKKNGIISFDPNIRLSLWADKEKYRNTILEFLPLANIVKISEDEIPFIFGNITKEDVASILLKTANEVIITLGSRGSILYTKEKTQAQNAMKVKAIDTTGAGDTFIGTYLRYRDTANNEKALKLASIASAIVCTKKGVLSALPSEEDINSFLSNVD